ncbi:28S ribosomal protein S29, mitochondrial-like isoform X1 [Limulus polyphemus]|uniref:Small ribosomal subunit protein mS29 n=2 Tax=Limulus polyphemus TaxID=6850 RepID=A0ABM1B277_LIMPO|nr:28S ribosomal protein S29, mitochondrial-like isoform X1 [Limulus polyphemus]
MASSVKWSMNYIHTLQKVALPNLQKLSANLSGIRYSSTEAVPSATPFAHFRTLESDPVNHTNNHEAQFYTMTPSVHKTLFQLGGISKSFEIQCKTFQEVCLMVRKPALEVMEYLKQANYDHPTIRYILYGRKGTGKTLTLAHLLHYGFNKKWMLLHVPWAPNWTRRPREIAPSISREGRIDMPVDAAVWLQQFKSQNEQLLKDLDLRAQKSYTWSKREVTQEGEPLLSIADHGINRMKHASDCVAVILKELREYSQKGMFTTFVAVDGVNCFFRPTDVKRENKVIVPADEITLIRAFKKLLKNDWNHGAVVVTVDEIASPVGYRDSHMPKYLLGQEGFELFEPFIPICVENYSRKEIESCLDYFIDRLWIQTEEGRTPEGKEELIFISGSNPYRLMEICKSR